MYVYWYLLHIRDRFTLLQVCKNSRPFIKRYNIRYNFKITQLYIPTENVGAKMGLDLKIATKNGKRYLYVAKIKINVDIKGYKIQREEKESSNQLSTIIQDFVGDNQQEIIKSLKPAVEELGSKRLILIINTMFKHFTYDEFISE